MVSTIEGGIERESETEEGKYIRKYEIDRESRKINQGEKGKHEKDSNYVPT